MSEPSDAAPKDPPPAVSKRRFLDRAPAPATVVGAGTVIVGNVRGAGPFVIAGEVRGDGDLAGHLHVALTGAWHGEIRARAALIAGKIIGSLHVDEKLEIARTAEIRGAVRARSVAIANGAVIDGDIEVTSGAAVVRFQEKRGD